MALKGKRYCNRCAHEMWYSEDDKRWHCTNPKCVKYKPQPVEEPEQESDRWK
jgi:predicted Zn-dependent protease